MNVIEALAEAAKQGKACHPQSFSDVCFAYGQDRLNREVVFAFARGSRGGKCSEVGLTANRRFLEDKWVLCPHPEVNFSGKKLNISDLAREK